MVDAESFLVSTDQFLADELNVIADSHLRTLAHAATMPFASVALIELNSAAAQRLQEIALALVEERLVITPKETEEKQ